jgi:signal transduction histidine kinase
VNEIKLLIVLVTVLGGTIALGLAWYAWRRRDVVSAFWFALYVAFTGAWTLSQGMVYLSPNLSIAELLVSITSLVSLPIPMLLFVWAATFTGSDEWLSSRVFWLLFLEPVAYAALYLTQGVHGLIQTSVTMETVGGVTLPTTSMGILEWVQMALSLLLVVAAFVLLVRYYVRARSIFRRQAGVIILGTVIPFIGILVLVTGFSPHPGLDTTAFAIVAQGAIIGWALFRYDFLEVTPIASDLLVEELPDPVLVFDRNDRLVDVNPAAADLFGAVSADDLETDHLPGGLLLAIDRGEQYEYDRGADRESLPGTTAIFEPISTDILDHRDIVRGRLVLLRDVTHQERRQRTLEELQQATRRFMTAETPLAVAEDLVTTIDRLLDHPYSAVLEPSADGGLRSVALSDDARAALGDETVTVPPETAPSPDELNDPIVVEGPDLDDLLGWSVDVESVLVLPIGDHGLVTIGAGAEVGGFTDEQRGFAAILANAAETAMARTDREAELRESQDLLERRNEQLEFFNSILRHDILNGLTVVEGNARLLEDHVDEEGREQLETIQNWTGDMADLTKQIRSIVTTLQESAETDLETVPIGAIVREKIDKIRDTYPEVSIDDDVGDIPPVVANDLVGQVIENILLNAVEHNDTDAPHIRVWDAVTDEEVCLHVADNGPGIPDDRKEDVFDPEYTSDAADTYGYGLYFVDTMVRAYGGKVRFEDSDLGGAEAVVTLQRGSYTW